MCIVGALWSAVAHEGGWLHYPKVLTPRWPDPHIGRRLGPLGGLDRLCGALLKRLATGMAGFDERDGLRILVTAVLLLEMSKYIVPNSTQLVVYTYISNHIT